jgi:hypothetical protein
MFVLAASSHLLALLAFLLSHPPPWLLQQLHLDALPLPQLLLAAIPWSQLLVPNSWHLMCQIPAVTRYQVDNNRRICSGPASFEETIFDEGHDP